MPSYGGLHCPTPTVPNPAIRQQLCPPGNMAAMLVLAHQQPPVPAAALPATTGDMQNHKEQALTQLWSGCCFCTTLHPTPNGLFSGQGTPPTTSIMAWTTACTCCATTCSCCKAAVFPPWQQTKPSRIGQLTCRLDYCAIPSPLPLTFGRRYTPF